MIRLLAVSGPRAGVEYALASGRTVVGRSSSSGVQLVDDAVSRHHAVFELSDDGLTLEDLGSQNGTLINGVRSQACMALNPDDVISIGATTFIVEPRLNYLHGPQGDVIVSDVGSPPSTAALRVRGDEVSAEAHEAASAALDLMSATAEQLTDEPWLSGMLQRMCQQLGAQRAFVARVQAELPDIVKVVASHGPGPITVSRTVVKEVLRGPSAIVSEDVSSDALLAAGLSLQLGEVHSLMAAPLVHAGRVIGLVHLDQAKQGAYGPKDLDRLLPFARVLGLVMLAQEGLQTRRSASRAHHVIEAPRAVACAPSSQALLAEAKKAAQSTAHVLITGDTGTGKEIVARWVHTQGPRAKGPFVAVNCGALAEALEESELFGHAKGAFTGASCDKPGLFEAAAGGTLFLDEVGETSLATQVKLLRALQEGVVSRLGETRVRPVDLRIVAATHQPLAERIVEGAFREDLYYRLAVIQLKVPRLRDRPEDIVPMAQRFAADIAQQGGLPPPELGADVQAALLRYGWPGNVRELKNIIERLVIMSEGSVLSVADLPSEMWSGADAARRAVSQGDSLAEAVGRLEREMILRCMARTGGNKSATAEALGISRVTLDAKLRNHGITWKR